VSISCCASLSKALERRSRDIQPPRCRISFESVPRPCLSHVFSQGSHGLISWHHMSRNSRRVGRKVWPMIWYSEHAMRQNDSHALHLILHDALLLISSFPAGKTCLPSGHTSSSAAHRPLGGTRGKLLTRGLGSLGFLVLCSFC
jgi:hypothetical protein